MTLNACYQLFINLIVFSTEVLPNVTKNDSEKKNERKALKGLKGKKLKYHREFRMNRKHNMMFESFTTLYLVSEVVWLHKARHMGLISFESLFIFFSLLR
ncbi:CLUMA_CG005382, isoform A [Clunio marinus]|uniref:CLUMA_CG005382, isoform A n=1 Tax=Clunio marinus TaxID=568069 RepID=A0A1J1HWL5_9DIPT|nr:CLUMA_CG005382, isoform A [Clunio marinus]